MKLCQFFKGNALHIGVPDGDRILDVTAMGRREGVLIPADIDAFIAIGDLGTLGGILETSPIYAEEGSIKYAPVVRNPQKILCAGANYADHIKEAGMQLPKVPVMFSKFNNSLNGHDCEVELINTAEQYDYEAELVAVIGKRGKFIPEDRASEYVFGYTCGNDLSARDVQIITTQYLMGKSFDGMCPIGPYLVTADSIDVSDLAIRARINGEVRQSSSTGHLIFTVTKLLSYASQYMTLEPGDIILTGTPGGVIFGYPPEKQVWLKKGDVVEVEIDGIGTLRNKMA
ncbi:MAG: fumarylacetoacetate hydrolase family protein [Oscillospiraceae bacterium]|nr:fumarylacetoacetate hydrolase family protein [Oscillospiraceae bacterium]